MWYDFGGWVPESATLKSWQGAISAGVGFVGVMLTLTVNSFLARKADSNKQRNDRTALRTAFETEFAFLQEQADGIITNLGKIDENPNGASLIKVALPTPVYDHNADKITVLTADEIREVLRVYLYLRTVSDRLLLLCTRTNIAVDPMDDWLSVPTHARNIVAANMKNVRHNAFVATKAISRARESE